MTRIARTLSAIGRETWRNPITFFLVWVPSLTVLILSVNPSLTADLAPLQRISFWLLHVSLLLPLLMIAQNVIDEMLAALCLSPVILVTLTAICASVAFAPVSMLLDLLFSPAPDLSSEPTLTLLLIDEITALALPTLCAWLLVNGARLTMLSVPLIQQESSEASERSTAQDTHDPAEQVRPASGLTDMEKAFWSRVPRELGADLVSLSAEQHYLHVVTTKGRSLVLFPIGRAIVAAERFDGMRIHRSHWVALRHVTALSKDDTGLYLCLSSGQKLPVSRSSQQAVKAALDADALSRVSSQVEARKAKAAS
jgi:hypothetical protein